MLEQMLAGVSTRRFVRTREPVGQDIVDAERSSSKSAVSREFVGRTGEHLRGLMTRSPADVRLAALMLDGLELKGRCYVVALGITTDGVKIPLGRWDGSRENKRVCVELLAAGMLQAEQQFRKIIGYKHLAHLAHLAIAVERDVASGRVATSRSTTSPNNINTTTEAAATRAAAH